MNELALRVRRERKRRRLRKRDAAREVGVQPATYGRLERGERNPKGKSLAGLLRFIGEDAPPGLTYAEWVIAQALRDHGSMTYQELSERVWGRPADESGNAVLRQHICHLRRKTGFVVRCEVGRGYVLGPEESA